MFGQRKQAATRRRREEAPSVIGIGTPQQETLAHIVRQVLLRARFTEAAFQGNGDDIDDTLVREGFVIEAPHWAHGESSIGVVHASHSGGYTEQTAKRIAAVLIRAFQTVVKPPAAQQLVQAKRMRIPDSDQHYINVTVMVPEDRVLQALNRRLGLG